MATRFMMGTLGERAGGAGGAGSAGELFRKLMQFMMRVAQG